MLCYHRKFIPTFVSEPEFMTFGQPEIEENDVYLEPEQFPEDNREIRKTIQKTSNDLNLEDENHFPETSTVIEATNKKQGKTRFTEEELSILKNFYAQNPYPSTKERERLANEINCLEKQIKYWFQNTRVAEKKSSANGLVNVSASYTLLENSTSHSHSASSSNSILYGEEQQHSDDESDEEFYGFQPPPPSPPESRMRRVKHVSSDEKQKMITKKRYHCPFCDKSYTQSHNLKLHKQIKHKIDSPSKTKIAASNEDEDDEDEMELVEIEDDQEDEEEELLLEESDDIYSCIISKNCKETFQSDKDLENHVLNQHDNLQLSRVDINELLLSKYQKRESNRLLTFKSWRYQNLVKPKSLVSAGFVYTGREDYVQCAFCAGIIGNWEEDDDPMVEHKKLFPRCAFVIQNA